MSSPHCAAVTNQAIARLDDVALAKMELDGVNVLAELDKVNLAEAA